jgi:hypothetical protein
VRHLTAEDVYKILLAENMDVGLATVYRVLTQFEQAGLLNRNHFETGKAIYELNAGSHHDHLVCLDCGHVEEFYDEEIEVAPAQDRHGARLQDRRARAGDLRQLRQDGLPAPRLIDSQRSGRRKNRKTAPMARHFFSVHKHQLASCCFAF